MATSNKGLNDSLRKFIRAQKVFFVATAAADGRVNLSPKGMDSLRIVSATKIVWLSVSGSGNETAAHLLEDPRMTLMFCAFEGDALITRLYGTAKTLYPRHEGWDELLKLFPKMAGSRQIFEMDIDLIQTSCGTGVPIMKFESERGPSELLPYYEEMGEDGVKAYWSRKNVKSIDGKDTGIFKLKPFLLGS